MRVLLLNPPRKTWSLMGDSVAPPIGLACLAGVLEHEGIDVRILDCNAEGVGWDRLSREISRISPDVVGVGALTPDVYHAVRALGIVKSVSGDIVTVAGGPHFTATVEESLTKYPQIDFIVVGEGERTLLELVRELERSRPNLKGVRGLAYRKGKNIVRTGPRPLIKDLDALPPPAYHLLPMDRYRFEVLGRRFFILEASRGCPHRCIFCSEWKFWGGCWRPRSMVKVAEQMEYLNDKYGRDFFWFADDTFNVDRGRLEELCREIESRGLDLCGEGGLPPETSGPAC